MKIRIIVETENLGAESFFELKGYYPHLSEFASDFGESMAANLVTCFMEAYGEVWTGVQRQLKDRENGNHLR